MTVEFGTSTPTSITVVETRMSICPAANWAMTEVFSSAGCLPCSRPMRNLPTFGFDLSASATATAAASGRFGFAASSMVSSSSSSSRASSAESSPSIRGQTTNAWRPAATSSATLAHTRATCAEFCSRTTWVVMPRRPPGNSVSVETSRSPKTVTAKVRGIGVAVMVKTCGGNLPLRRNASRCSTPKRCCSSTTIRPRSKNDTASAIRA